MSDEVEIDLPLTSNPMESETIRLGRSSQSGISGTHSPVVASSSQQSDTSETAMDSETTRRSQRRSRSIISRWPCCTSGTQGPVVAASSQQSDSSIGPTPEYHDPKDQDVIEKRLSPYLWQLDIRRWNNWKEFLNPFGPDRLTIAHIAAFAGKVDILKRALDLYAEERELFTHRTEERMKHPLLHQDIHGRYAVHYAAFRDQREVVKWILDRWDLETRHQIPLVDHDGTTPLHDAVRCLNVNVVKLLVERGFVLALPNKHGVPPFLSFDMRELVNGCKAREHPSERYYEIVKFILEENDDLEESERVDINLDHPSIGWTMLHYAIYLRSHEAVQYLVEQGADPNMIRLDARRQDAVCKVFAWHSYSHGPFGSSALQYAAYQRDLESVRILVNNGGNLVKPYPTSSLTVIAELCGIMNTVVIENFLTGLFDEQLRSEYTYNDEVIVTFGILAPRVEPRQMAVVSALIEAMPRERLHKILKHPFLQIYIRRQWRRFSTLLYSFLALYVIFVILLSWYTIHLVNSNGDPDVWLPVSLLSSACILFLQNLLQFSAEPKWFCMQAETWLSFVSPTLSIAIAINGLHTSNTSTSWVLYVLSVVLPLSWIQMLQFFAKLEFLPWGHYALLLDIVLKNVLKVLSIGSVVVLGFSLSFFILFHNNDQFDNPWKAIAKTMVMMTGEYEYGDLFGISETKNSTDRNPMYDDLPLVTGRIAFIVFMIITNIVLMNLMTALALIDVQALVSKGELERSRQRAMFIAHWEQVTRKYREPSLPVGLTKMIRKHFKRTETLCEFEIFRPNGCPPSGISKDVWKAIFTLHEKNKPDRPRFREMETDNTQVTLASIQASLESIKSEIQQLKQDRHADVQQAIPGCGCGDRLNQN